MPDVVDGQLHGIIPARAGFTRRRRDGVGRRRDHPRSRGVYPPQPARHRSESGSSPLARGLRMSSVLRRRRAGSSPLARGLRAPGAGQLVGSGIIPARAGFTAHRRRLLPRAGDHPRSRGVYAGSRARGSTAPGSSPLARGLQNFVETVVNAAGIIPARAGFTSRTGGRGRVGWDHPRSRGVYGTVSSDAERRQGSSPLARGLLQVRRTHEPRARIIPARAGFTGSVVGSSLVGGDHPRSRGVYVQKP